jgi:hypothetical protein
MLLIAALLLAAAQSAQAADTYTLSIEHNPCALLALLLQ